MVGKLEAMLERPGRDAAVEVALRRRILFPAGHSKQVRLEGYIEIVSREPRDSNRNPIAVIAGLDDVVRRPITD